MTAPHEGWRAGLSLRRGGSEKRRPLRFAEARSLSAMLSTLLHARPGPPSVVAEEAVVIARAKGEGAHAQRIGRGSLKVKSPVLIWPPKSLRREKLEAVPNPNLYLSGIPEPISNRPVEVEQQRCRRRIAEIVAIENVEHLDHRSRSGRCAPCGKDAKA